MPRITVGIRVKPEKSEDVMRSMVFRENPKGGKLIDITVSGQRNEFSFDTIFEENSTQQEVFETSATKICESVIDGYNGCIFAYGQTGAGKTHTMTGPSANDYAERGLCMRTIGYLFEKSRQITPDNLAIRLSVLEIYNESLTDLLRSSDMDGQCVASANNGNFTSFGRSVVPGAINAPNDAPKLTIVDTPMGVLIPSLYILPLSSEEEAYTMLLEAYSNRVVAEHQLNRRSSRSHVIYTFYITRTKALPPTRATPKSLSVNKRGGGSASGGTTQRGGGGNEVAEAEDVVQSKLHLVDLAGSERVEKTKSTGTVQKEANHINRSLSFLEQVVLALTQSKRDHIPYRQSKLTYILKDSLGGNSNTCMIACIWPHRDHGWETLSTLRFASRMKCIENTPIRNSLVAKVDPSSTRLLQQIEALKKELVLRDAVAGREAWLPTLSRPQREKVVTQAVRFFGEPPFQSSNVAVASTASSSSKATPDTATLLLDWLESDALTDGSVEEEAAMLTVQSLSHVRLLAKTFRGLFWEACDQNTDRVREVLKKCAPKDTRLYVDVNRHLETLVEEAEETVPGQMWNKDINQSELSPAQESHANESGLNTPAAAAAPASVPLWNFDDFTAGPGKELFAAFEDCKESVRVNKQRQSEIVRMINSIKLTIDELSEQLSHLRRQEGVASTSPAVVSRSDPVGNDDDDGEDNRQPNEVAGDGSGTTENLEGSSHQQEVIALKEQIAEAKRQYRLAHGELQLCRSQVAELQSLRQRSLASLMRAFEMANAQLS